MADYGLKVTKDGYSITSTNPADYVFSTKYGTVKIVKEGSGNVIVAGSGDTVVTIRHDLGFIPMVHLYTEPTPGSGIWRFGCPYYLSDDSYVTANGNDTYVDNINFVFRIYNRNASQKTFKYYYFIFSDPV